MREFVVVDLGSQAYAVACFVAGWPKQRFLAWLGEYGEVVRVREWSSVEEYAFLSYCGIGSGFSYDRQGRLVLQARLGRNGLYDLVV